MIYDAERAEAYRRRAAWRAYLVAPADKVWAHWAGVLNRHIIRGKRKPWSVTEDVPGFGRVTVSGEGSGPFTYVPRLWPESAL